jgi:hypothetical protein
MWVEPDSTLIDELWPDAPSDPETLELLLESAYEQCLEYAPVVAPIPANFKLAQILQARAIHRSTATGSGDQMGGEGFTVTVYPMDWTVRNLLRPKRVGRVL